MSEKIFFTLIPLLAVAAFAIFMVMHKRRSIKPSHGRFVHRDPVIKRKPATSAASSENRKVIIDDLVADEEIYDQDIVETREAMSESIVRSTPRRQTGEMIIIGLLAEKAHPYRGYELLQAMLTAGLRFNRKGVFYRHENMHGKGDILFTLVSAEPPGIFDLPKMGSFSTRGLTLFIDLDTVKDPQKALDALLQSAQSLVDDLGGEIWDDERKPLTAQKIEQWRQKIADLTSA